MFHISVLLALVLLGIFLRALKNARARVDQLRMIPTVGPSGVFSSYIGAIRYIFDAQSILQEGYDKYHSDPGLFKVPLLDRWQVLVCSPSTIADIKTAPESRVSARDAVSEILEGQYTLGPSIFTDPYHSSIVQGPLTRSLAKRFPEMYEEAALAFAEEFRNRNADADEWCQIPVWSMVLNVVSRTTTNFMLGSSLCRNRDWLALNIKFAKDVALTIGIINLFPNVLKPFAGNFLTPVPYTVARAVKHLEPLYAERMLQNQAKKINDDDDDNNDLISWIITEIQSDHHPQLRLGSQQQKIRELTTRVLAIQFFSIYTTSVIFTHALFYLAQNQNLSLVDFLREEIEACVQKHGWTKAATEEMFNLESVMGEVMRLAPLNGVLIDRIPRDDFTFSNGISVPRGTLLGIPIYCINRDEMHHANAEQFDGFRFANPQQEGGRYKMTTSSAKNLGFGLGRAACPGRFFVANELKMFLAHVLITYDFRFKNQKDNIPEFRWFSQRIVPDTTATLLFQKRKTSC